MKRWHKRSIIIIAMGMVGVAALGLRPAMVPPTAKAITKAPHAETPLPAHYVTGGMKVTYRWELTEPPPHTVLRGAAGENVFGMVKPAQWEITIQAKDGKLTADYTTPILHAKNNTHSTATQYHAYFGAPVKYYLPSGSASLKYYLYLQCQSTLTPPFWQTAQCTTAVQLLCIDVAQGTVDLVPPPAIREDATCRIIRSGPTPDLPARFCGTEREQAVQHLLYDFADTARTPSGSRFRKFVQQAETAVQQYTAADLPWPQCWGDAAAEATRANTLIHATVRELRHHNYYGSAALKEFMDSPTFARIFGNTAEQEQDANPIDVFGTGTEGIIFEEIQDSHFAENEKNLQNH